MKRSITGEEGSEPRPLTPFLPPPLPRLVTPTLRPLHWMTHFIFRHGKYHFSRLKLLLLNPDHHILPASFRDPTTRPFSSCYSHYPLSLSRVCEFFVRRMMAVNKYLKNSILSIGIYTFHYRYLYQIIQQSINSVYDFFKGMREEQKINEIGKKERNNFASSRS